MKRLVDRDPCDGIKLVIINVQAEPTHCRDYSVVARQAVEQSRMAFETRHQSLMRHAMSMHHLREHNLMGRFGKGHGGGDAVDTAQLNPWYALAPLAMG